jgi:hypothetical protein
MGLDTIAYKEFSNGEHVEADSEWFTGTEELSRGIMAVGDTGNLAWIRGKVYAHFLEQISGVSLYQESISNETVWKIANSLKTYNDNPLKYSDVFFTYNLPKRELKTLERWFFIAAERGCYLHGWW